MVQKAKEEGVGEGGWGNGRCGGKGVEECKVRWSGALWVEGEVGVRGFWKRALGVATGLRGGRGCEAGWLELGRIGALG